MYIFFMPFLFLPLIEIIGFITIGAKLGVFLTLVWLACATTLGFYLLGIGGSGAWTRARDKGDDFFLIEDAFDNLCLLIAAILLIFPGFISDFIAVPFMLTPFRHWLFRRTKSDPDSFMRRSYHSYSRKGQSSTATETVIEGEFRHVDDTKKLQE